MAHVVNISSRVFPLEIGTVAGKKPMRFDMKPGDVVEVDDAYGMRRAPNPSAESIPSIVDLLTNGCVVPASDPRAKDLYAAWQAKHGGGGEQIVAGVDDPIAAPAPCGKAR
jgi:hypothetical protein